MSDPFPLCRQWRERLPPLLDGAPEGDALAGSTFDAIVHLVEIGLRAQLAGQAHLARAADDGARALAATLNEVERDQLGAALAMTLTPAEAEACGRCASPEALLHAFGRVPGARCAACWAVTFDDVTAWEGPAPTRWRRGKVRVRVDAAVFESERSVSFDVSADTCALIVDARALEGDLLDVGVLAEDGDALWIGLPGEALDGRKCVKVPRTSVILGAPGPNDAARRAW